MKTLIFIFAVLILVLLPVKGFADDSQNIVFTGTYSFNNEGTDADSAWLFIRYDGTLVDSTKITPEDLQWDGYYQYIHACTNDSVWGWSGWWIYFDGLTVSIPELATIATARDSSYALAADIADDVWNEWMDLPGVNAKAREIMAAIAPIKSSVVTAGNNWNTTTKFHVGSDIQWYGDNNWVDQLVIFYEFDGNSDKVMTYYANGDTVIMPQVRRFVATSEDSPWVEIDVPIKAGIYDGAYKTIDMIPPEGLDFMILGQYSPAVGDTNTDPFDNATDEVAADMVKISGDATAADNLETMLDGTGGQQLTLKRLSIDGANSTSGSFYVNNDDGHGTIFTTSSTDAPHSGLYCSATANNPGYGLFFVGSGTGAGIVGFGGASGGSGMYLLGQGGGHGLNLLGNTAGDGLYAAGGATGGDGIHLVGDDTGHDLNATLNLDDVKGDYDKDDYEDDFFETMSDSLRIRLDSLFTQANSLLDMIDGGNELVDLDTLKWLVAMMDTMIDSLLTQAWASVDACAGAGAYTCTLTVVDTTNDATVSGVQVTVNNQTEDGTEYFLTSNSSGHAIVSLNNGDYRASALSPPYVFASTDFTIASAVLHDSILGYSFVIDAPPSADVATVYGYFISGGHDTLRNMDVTFELEGYATVIDTASDALVTAKIVRVVTDGNGKVETTLLKNENLITADGDSLAHPWWTCKAADPTFPFTIHFTIDNDSTTFNLGVESDAVQFRRR